MTLAKGLVAVSEETLLKWAAVIEAAKVVEASAWRTYIGWEHEAVPVSVWDAFRTAVVALDTNATQNPSLDVPK